MTEGFLRARQSAPELGNVDNIIVNQTGNVHHLRYHGNRPLALDHRTVTYIHTQHVQLHAVTNVRVKFRTKVGERKYLGTEPICSLTQLAISKATVGLKAFPRPLK